MAVYESKGGIESESGKVKSVALVMKVKAGLDLGWIAPFDFSLSLFSLSYIFFSPCFHFHFNFSRTVASVMKVKAGLDLGCIAPLECFLFLVMPTFLISLSLFFPFTFYRSVVAVMKVKGGLDPGCIAPLGGSNLFHWLGHQTHVTNLERVALDQKIPLDDNSISHL